MTNILMIVGAFMLQSVALFAAFTFSFVIASQWRLRYLIIALVSILAGAGAMLLALGV